MHATADLHATLDRLKTLLVPGGTLFLLEVTGFERWIDLTFGLTEGWWRFNDVDLRPHYPLLDRKRWRAVLEASGFAAGEIGAALPTSRQALLVGRKPLARVPRRWALLGEGAGLAAEVRAHLTALGHDAQSITPLASAGSFDDIVCFNFLDIAGPSQTPLADQRVATEPVLAAIRCLGAAARQQRLWIVTRGAIAATATDLANPAQAAALGIRRAAELEHPDWHPTLVDLDPNASTAMQVEQLVAQLLSQGGEGERAVRAGRLFSSRLTRLRQEQPAPMCLEASETGVLDRLRLMPASRRAPGPCEVEIRVAASGLNFRDVMNALAIRADGEPLGGECAGVVTAVGTKVNEFAVGDSVVAAGAGTFATYVTVDARAVAHRPRGLSDAQAAALPLAAMTAHHALVEIAQLQPGQSALIHAGAGGLGMAAIAAAQRLGARVVATAGSEAKRSVLRDLGVEHVFSSRTLAFETEIMRITEGRGVDVVLEFAGWRFHRGKRADACLGRGFPGTRQAGHLDEERFCALVPPRAIIRSISGACGWKNRRAGAHCSKASSRTRPAATLSTASARLPAGARSGRIRVHGIGSPRRQDRVGTSKVGQSAGFADSIRRASIL